VKAYSNEIEAAISLWLYSVYDEENPPATQDSYGNTYRVTKEPNAHGRSKSKTSHLGDDDAWLRATGAQRKRSLRLLGWKTTPLDQCLKLWTPESPHIELPFSIEKTERTSTSPVHKLRLTAATSAERKTAQLTAYFSAPTPDATPSVRRPTLGASDTTSDLESYRIVGYADDMKYSSLATTDTISEKGGRRVLLAAESYAALPTLYAQHMFTAFMTAASRSPEIRRIGSEAEVRPVGPDSNNITSLNQSLFTMHNADLSELAQSIHATGIGSLEEVYMMIIPALCDANKLPRTNPIITAVHQRARAHESLEHWKAAAAEYLWLFQVNEWFPKEMGIAVKTTALLMEFLRSVTNALALCETQQRGSIKELEDLKSKLEEKIRDKAGRDADGHYIVSGVFWLFHKQARPWSHGLLKSFEYLDIRDPDDQMLRFLELKTPAAGRRLDDIYPWNANADEASQEDVLGWTRLHYAAARGHQESIRFLLQLSVDLNAPDVRGWTPLHYSCLEGSIGVVRGLLQNGAQTNSYGIDGIAPVHCAAMAGNQKIMQALFESGVDMNQVDNLGNTPLMWAAYKGRRAMAKYLQDKVNIELRNRDGRTPLHLSVVADIGNDAEGRYSFVHDVVEVVRNCLEERDRNTETPLHLAARHGIKGAVKALLDAGANTKARDRDGMTPLHLAARYDSEGVVKVLLDARSDTEARDRDGMTPLYHAARYDNEGIVKALLHAGANTEARDRDGRTPLHLAARYYSDAVVKALLTAGANIEAGDGDGMTPLHHAAFNDSWGVVKILLDKEADKEAKDGDGMTPLHHAAHVSIKSIVKALLDAGANKEAKDGDGMTPLHHAAFNNNKGVVTVLLDVGADKEAKDGEGRTPLQIAEFYGIEDAVDALSTR